MEPCAHMGSAQGGALRGGASRRSLHPIGSSAPERRWAVRSSRTLSSRPLGHARRRAGSAVLSDTARRPSAGVNVVRTLLSSPGAAEVRGSVGEGGTHRWGVWATNEGPLHWLPIPLTSQVPGHLDVVGRLNPQDVQCAPSTLDALWGTRSPAKT